MNPEQFILIMNNLPDAVIDSANAPVIRQKRKAVFMIPAAAACFLVLIAAAVYPKLQPQKPEVAEPPVIAAETTVPVTTGSEQPVTTGTQSVITDVQTTAAVTVTVYTTAVTAPAETTAEQPETEEPGTEPPQTEPPADTTLPLQNQTAVISWQTTPDTLATEPQAVTVPVWKGRIAEASAYTEQTPPECQFSICPQDVSDWNRMKYGIPADYDLTQHPCLLIEIRTGYTRMAVHGGELTADGLTLYIDRLDQYAENAYIRCAIPVPDGFTLLPENCRAEYLNAENEAEYLENRIEQPTITIKK